MSKGQALFVDCTAFLAFGYLRCCSYRSNNVGSKDARMQQYKTTVREIKREIR